MEKKGESFHSTLMRSKRVLSGTYLVSVSIHFEEIPGSFHQLTLEWSSRIVDDFGMIRLDKFHVGKVLNLFHNLIQRINKNKRQFSCNGS